MAEQPRRAQERLPSDVPKVPLLSLKRTELGTPPASLESPISHRFFLTANPQSPALISDVASCDEAEGTIEAPKALTFRGALLHRDGPTAPRGSLTHRVLSGSSEQNALPGEGTKLAALSSSKQTAFKEWRDAMKALAGAARRARQREPQDQTAEPATREDEDLSSPRRLPPSSPSPDCGSCQGWNKAPQHKPAEEVAASQAEGAGSGRPSSRHSLIEQAAAARDFAMRLLHFSSQVEEQKLHQRLRQSGAMTSRVLPSDAAPSRGGPAPRRSFFLNGGVSSHMPLVSESRYAERLRMQQLARALETQKKRSQAQTPRGGSLQQPGTVRVTRSSSRSSFSQRRSFSGEGGAGDWRSAKVESLMQDTQVRATAEKARALSIAKQRGAPDKLVGSYLLGKTIGEGTFCKVRAATHAVTGECVAVKVIGKEQLKEAADAERVCREVHILKAVRHPHVVRLLEVLETPSHLYLVMEYASGGELFDFIVQRRRVDEATACKIFRQLIAGVEALHSLCICHRDLKPENLLLDEEGQLKIIDFGLSNLYRHKCLLRTACGSPSYAAPEMILGKLYSPLAVDVWSCGIVLYALLTGRLPFEEATTECLYRRIVKGAFECPDYLSGDAVSLLRGILCTNPLKRWSPAQIRRHPWFRDAAPGYKPPRNPDIMKWPQGPPSCGCSACASWISSESQSLDRDLLRQIPADGMALDALEAHIISNPVGAHAATYHLLMSRRRKEEQFRREEARRLVEESGLNSHSLLRPSSSCTRRASCSASGRRVSYMIATSPKASAKLRPRRASASKGPSPGLPPPPAPPEEQAAQPPVGEGLTEKTPAEVALPVETQLQRQASNGGVTEEEASPQVRDFEAAALYPEEKDSSPEPPRPPPREVLAETAPEETTPEDAGSESPSPDRPSSQSVCVAVALDGSEEVLPERAALSELTEEARRIEMERIQKIEAQRMHVLEQMRRLAEGSGHPRPCAFLKGHVVDSLLLMQNSINKACLSATESKRQEGGGNARSGPVAPPSVPSKDQRSRPSPAVLSASATMSVRRAEARLRGASAAVSSSSSSSSSAPQRQQQRTSVRGGSISLPIWKRSFEKASTKERPVPKGSLSGREAFSRRSLSRPIPLPVRPQPALTHRALASTPVPPGGLTARGSLTAREGRGRVSVHPAVSLGPTQTRANAGPVTERRALPTLIKASSTPCEADINRPCPRTLRSSSILSGSCTHRSLERQGPGISVGGSLTARPKPAGPPLAGRATPASRLATTRPRSRERKRPSSVAASQGSTSSQGGKNAASRLTRLVAKPSKDEEEKARDGPAVPLLSRLQKSTRASVLRRKAEGDEEALPAKTPRGLNASEDKQAGRMRPRGASELVGGGGKALLTTRSRGTSNAPTLGGAKLASATARDGGAGRSDAGLGAKVPLDKDKGKELKETTQTRGARRSGSEVPSLRLSLPQGLAASLASKTRPPQTARRVPPPLQRETGPIFQHKEARLNSGPHGRRVGTMAAPIPGSGPAKSASNSLTKASSPKPPRTMPSRGGSFL